MNEQQDDFDLEVSSLQSSALTNSTEALDPDESSHPQVSTSADSLAPIAQRAFVTTRLPRQLRYLRAGSVVALLVLLLCAVLLLPASNRVAVLRLLTPPTPLPTATPLAGEDAFLWQHSVPWGQLFVDGRLGPDVRGSAIQQDAQGAPRSAAFHLAPGRHTLEYRAYPFPTMACQVSVPASRDDTCLLAHLLDFSYLVPDAPATRLLDLQATIDRLPTAFVDELLGTTQAYLDTLAHALPTGVLAAGDHYLDRSGEMTQAKSALRIAPQFGLDSSVQQLDGVTCVTLCTPTGFFPPPSADQWALIAPVALSWRYTTPGGQVVIADGPAQPPGTLPYDMISLQVGWNEGDWQTPTAVLAASETDPVICPAGAHALTVVQAQTNSLRYQWPIATSTAELGCLLAGSDTDPSSGTPTGAIALVLYRAGALIAANAPAHQVFPTLPMASAHERALALAVAPTSLP